MSLSNMDTNAKALNDLLTKAVQENKRNYADQWAKLAKFPTQYIGIQFTDWDVEDIRRMVQSRIESAIANRLDVMEFAEDENGNPDGVKNYQEMLITIASDIANDISELVFGIAEKELDEELNLRVTKMITEGHKED